MAESDPYVYPGTEVLRNKLGLRDAAALEDAERELTSIRLAELERGPLAGQFDFDHLKETHAHIFQDLYEWAGKVRTGEIAKGPVPFAFVNTIESQATKLFTALTKENYLRDLDHGAFTLRVSYYLGEINALHPFREGNGRAQRMFIQTLAKAAGHELSWKGISQQEMIDASIDSFMGDGNKLTQLLRKATPQV